MKKFLCAGCGHQVFFENSRCLSCQSELGFVTEDLTIATFKAPGRNKAQQRIGGRGLYRRCGNLRNGICNWMLPANAPDTFCPACRLNRTIPDLSKSQNQQAWLKLETAKRRLIYSLLSLGLPVPSRQEDPARGLAFDFLEAPGSPGGAPVLTGHSAGLITINLDETDDSSREKARQRMGEMYRTVLGHFRHEVGHYYWDMFVSKSPEIDQFREMFGDERADYAVSLERYYQTGPPANWQQRHVSAYAASHPWEDWAETWAHYLHILDTLETAAAEGLVIQNCSSQMVVRTPLGMPFSEIATEWFSVRLLLNELNRSMGFPDPYPFVLSDTVVGKLTRIHDWIAMWRS